MIRTAAALLAAVKWGSGGLACRYEPGRSGGAAEQPASRCLQCASGRLQRQSAGCASGSLNACCAEWDEAVACSAVLSDDEPAVADNVLQDLAEKIEQLNAAIDEVSSRIGQDGTEVEEAASVAA